MSARRLDPRGERAAAREAEQLRAVRMDTTAREAVTYARKTYQNDCIVYLMQQTPTRSSNT